MNLGRVALGPRIRFGLCRLIVGIRLLLLALL
jgi:hypothetical protein